MVESFRKPPRHEEQRTELPVCARGRTRVAGFLTYLQGTLEGKVCGDRGAKTKVGVADPKQGRRYGCAGVARFIQRELALERSQRAPEIGVAEVIEAGLVDHRRSHREPAKLFSRVGAEQERICAEISVLLLAQREAAVAMESNGADSAVFCDQSVDCGKRGVGVVGLQSFVRFLQCVVQAYVGWLATTRGDIRGKRFRIRSQCRCRESAGEVELATETEFVDDAPWVGFVVGREGLQFRGRC